MRQRFEADVSFYFLYGVEISIKSIQHLLGILIIPACFYSTAITTFCIAGFVVLAFFNIRSIKNVPWYIWACTLVYWQVVISGINTEDLDEWHSALFLKLPFLLLPIAFFLLPRFSIRDIYNFHLWLFITVWASVIPILINYFQHQELYLSNLGMGQAIPTPIHHVLYGMIMSYSLVSTLYILIKDRTLYSDCRAYLYTGVVGLFVVQHILTIRTGLLVTYVSLPILFWVVLKNRKLIIGAVAILFLIGIVSTQVIPSFNTRIAYMRYDLEQFRSGAGSGYADSERIYSLRRGLELWQSHPLIGVGVGDLRNEMKQIGINKLPHSQWIYLLASGGIVGLILFLLGLVIPFYNYKGPMQGLLILLYLNLIICLTLDFVMERSVIIAFFNFFGLGILLSREK